MSRYQNCFYYFRGPRNTSREVRAAKQLEDNTTKALINVLEHGGPDLTTDFLRQVIGKDVRGSVQAQFFLQEGPLDPAPSRMLVGLAILDQIDQASWVDSESAGGSRIDGAIHVPGELTVLLETKVVDHLDGAQMNRHASRWGMSEATPGTPDDELPPGWKLTTWTDVDRWARGLTGKDLSPVQGFLVGQLIEFLGFAGLSVSWVYEPQHFDFFIKEPREKDDQVRNEIRARLASIWERIKEEIGPDEFTRTFGDVYVGNLGNSADHGWAQTNADDKSGLPNLTIEISAEETMVNLVGWFDLQLSRTKQLLRTPPGDRFVKENPEYELVLFLRKGNPSKTGKHVVWQGAKHELVSRTAFADASSEELIQAIEDFEEGLNHKLEKASIHIRRAWTKDEAVWNHDLPSEMAREIERLKPVLELTRSHRKDQN